MSNVDPASKSSNVDPASKSSKVDPTPSEEREQSGGPAKPQDEKIASTVFTSRGGSRPLSVDEGVAQGSPRGSGNTRKTLFSTGATTGEGKASQKSQPRGAVRSSDPSARGRGAGRGWREKLKSARPGGEITVIEPLETRRRKQGIEPKQFEDSETRNVTPAASQLPCRGVSPKTTTENPSPPPPPEEKRRDESSAPHKPASTLQVPKQDSPPPLPISSSTPPTQPPVEEEEEEEEEEEGEEEVPVVTAAQLTKPKRYSSRRGKAFETEGAVTLEQVERDPGTYVLHMVTWCWDSFNDIAIGTFT